MKKQEKHGMYKSKEYVAWTHIIQRCTNKNSRVYKYYGGRGIKVCNEWRNSFIRFYKDVGKSPSKKHSIDRIDNDGDYEPSNCKWSTYKEQANNKRKENMGRKRASLILEYNGEKLSVKEWGEKIKMNPETLRQRIKRGIPVKDAIEYPAINTGLPFYERRY